MKKLKILMPIATTLSVAAVIAPLASCSCKKAEDEGVKVNLTVTSEDGITVKETNIELNKDSTVSLNVPKMKAIATVYMHVGTVVLKENKDFTVDYNENIIKINGSVLNNKDVEITIFTTTQIGIKAKLADSSKVFEALEVIKASDVVVLPIYEQSTKAAKPLTYGSDYLVYDEDGNEIEKFDTVGYTVTRADGVEGSKWFAFEFEAPKETYECELEVETCQRMEPKSIEVSTCAATFVDDTITSKDIAVKATMTDTTTRMLEYGKDYTVWRGSKEIEDFGENGYKFEDEGTTELTIKSVENPEQAIQSIKYTVNPAIMKTALCVTNTSEEGGPTASLTTNGNYKFYDSERKDWFNISEFRGFIKPGQTIMLKGNNPEGCGEESFKIEISSQSSSNAAKIVLSGSVLGLINNNNPANNPKFLPSNCFANLFTRSNAIYSVSSDFLGNVDAKTSAFQLMFAQCPNLVAAPDIPDINMIGSYNCKLMFVECEKLVKAPLLLPKALSYGCYEGMFNGCIALPEAPELPATKHIFRSEETGEIYTLDGLPGSCYNEMFMGCKSLIKAPALPAKIISDGSYQNMFNQCSALMEASELPATKHYDAETNEIIEGLPDSCYWQMFFQCRSLKNIPEILPATTLGEKCYQGMFNECSSLEKAPILPADKLASRCYQGMFSKCKSLTETPALPANKLEESCYDSMFEFCNKLKQCPTLGASELANGCYSGMFQHCTSLESTPSLEAKVLKQSCYKGMFIGCTSLKQVTQLPDVDELAAGCYINMFANCSGLKVEKGEGEGKHPIIKIKNITDPAERTKYYADIFTGTKDWPGEVVEADTTYCWVEY